MADRVRQTKRAIFRGMNTRLAADVMQEGKYPVALNIRADGDSRIKTRPGYSMTPDSGSSGSGFSTGAAKITDMRAYAALGTDNKPRILVHDSGGSVWLDNGLKQGTVGQGGTGASLIPVRPNQSPQSWMYIGNATGYRKFSAPDVNNSVIQEKVGIAEPQGLPEACVDGFQYNEFSSVAASWSHAGTAGSTSDVQRSTDTVTAIFQDPASVSPVTKTRYSVQIGTSVVYQAGETLTFQKSGGGTIAAEVEDVYPPINGGTALTIQAIYYFSGSTGRCIVVPSQLALGGLTTPTASTPGATTPPAIAPQLAFLRRGSLVKLNAEVVFVLSVTTGPQGQLCFECSTTGTHLVSETIIGIPAIAVSGISALVVGQTVTAAQINSVVSKGVGTLTQTLSPNPFNEALGTFGVPQDDDLLHVSFTADVPGNITELKIIFDVGDGSFTQNLLYFAIEASTLQTAATNAVTQSSAASQQTNFQSIYQALLNSGYNQFAATGLATAVVQGTAQLIYDPGTGKATIVNKAGQQFTLTSQVSSGAGQYTEVLISLQSLLRVGNDQTKTLANCNAVQILANVTATTTIGFGSIWVGGGGQPNVGVNGSPYYYRCVPRYSLTGATGNPSPETQYGVLPSNQPVIVSLPSAAYDAQIDTWDIERYGGSVTSWRYIGTAIGAATTFRDNVTDAAALAGSEMEVDNFEPWPTVDVPWNASTGVGTISSISVIGTAIVILGPSTAFLASTLRWLPGTLLTLDGQYVYTLRNRPVSISGGVLFRTIECAGAPSVSTIVVNEPIVANQPLPYLWGPDANGVVYAAGDPYRPGTFQPSKPNNPDATPNNAYDLVPPSEPLLGGEIVDGLSLVASSRRWWQLQLAPGTPQGVIPVETPAGRGLASPYGHCTDGKAVYFVAKDGIYSMVPGLPANPLADEDIGNLFPHDGVPGQNIVYAGRTMYAPDYSRAALFRLSIINFILRFHYFDTTGTPRTLILDMSLDSAGRPRMAWSIDTLADPITVSYQPEQPAGTLNSTSAAYSQCYYGDTNGKVWVETDLHNDNLTPISPILGTPEWDAGDARVNKQWLDAMVDVIAPSGVSISGVFNGSTVGTPQSVASSTSRLQSLPPLSNVLGNYLGILFSWTDDFTKQSIPTQILEWSAEFVPQPILIRSWQSVPTSHGLQGYHHIPRIRFAYMTVDTNPVTLTITAFDGTSPAVLSLPGTSGAYQKTEFVLTFNKGLLYTYQGSHPTGWAPILEDCEILVGAWDRSGPYAVFKDLGGVEAA